MSATNPTIEREYILLLDENVGAGERQLGPVTNDVGFVDYDIRDNHRLFLFEQDLERGITVGEYLQLPATLQPAFDSSVTLEDPSKWKSFRAYDVGVCSELLPWQVFVFGFVMNYEDGFGDNPAVEGGSIRENAVTPIIQASRRSNALRNDADGLRVELELHAQTVTLSNVNLGGLETCDDVTIRVDMTLRIAKDDDVLVQIAPGGFAPEPPDLPDECPGVGDPGATRMIFDNFSGDVFATVEQVDVDVTGCGAVNGRFADEFRSAIESDLPLSSRRGFRRLLLKDPRALGVPEDEIRGCQCDSQCNLFSPDGPAYPGKRHICHLLEPGAECETDADCDAFYHEEPGQPGYACQNVGSERLCVAEFFPIRRGECWVQLEPDRINVRPDGMEYVSIGNDDPQSSVVLNDRDGDGEWDGRYSRANCDPPNDGEPERGNFLPPTAAPRVGVFEPPFSM